MFNNTTMLNATMLNNATNTSGHITEHREQGQTATAVFFLLITMALALVGNTAVIAVIATFRSMRRDISNLLIINLSITDLSMTIFVMISSVVSLIMDSWVFGSFWCDFVCATNYCLIIVSMLTLCFISLDRYHAVLNPLKYHRLVTRKKILMMIAYSWFQGIVFASIPPIMKWVEYDYWEAVCAIQWFRHQDRAIYYVISAFALCFLGPGIILVFNYLKILKEAKKQKNQIIAQPAGQTQDKKGDNSKSTRIVWSLLVVVFAYFICTTPFSLTKLIKVLATSEDFIPGPVNLTASLLGYVASAINPLIYGIFRRDFRAAYKGLLRKMIHWKGDDQTPVSFFNHSDYPPSINICQNDIVKESPKISDNGTCQPSEGKFS